MATLPDRNVAGGRDGVVTSGGGHSTGRVSGELLWWAACPHPTLSRADAGEGDRSSMGGARRGLEETSNRPTSGGGPPQGESESGASMVGGVPSPPPSPARTRARAIGRQWGGTPRLEADLKSFLSPFPRSGEEGTARSTPTTAWRGRHSQVLLPVSRRGDGQDEGPTTSGAGRPQPVRLPQAEKGPGSGSRPGPGRAARSPSRCGTTDRARRVWTSTTRLRTPRHRRIARRSCAGVLPGP